MKKNILLSLTLAFASSSAPVFASSAGCSNLPLSVVESGIVSQNSIPVITPKGFGPIRLGMTKKEIKPRVEGLYDRYIVVEEENVMGDLYDRHLLKRGNQLVAEIYLDDEDRIDYIEIYVNGARTEDGKYEVGMEFSKALACDTFNECYPAEIYTIANAKGCPYTLMTDCYEEVLTPAGLQQWDKSTGDKVLLTPNMVKPSALLRAIAI